MRDPAQKTSLVFVFSSKSFFCDERKETNFFIFSKNFSVFSKKKKREKNERKKKRQKKSVVVDTSKPDVCLRTPKPTGGTLSTRMHPRRREEEEAAAAEEEEEEEDADLLDAGDFDRTVALGGMHFRFVSFFSSFRVTDTDVSSSSSSSSSSIQKDLPDGCSYTTWA
jgi:hypothetical protein